MLGCCSLSLPGSLICFSFLGGGGLNAQYSVLWFIAPLYYITIVREFFLCVFFLVLLFFRHVPSFAEESKISQRLLLPPYCFSKNEAKKIARCVHEP